MNPDDQLIFWNYYGDVLNKKHNIKERIKVVTRQNQDEQIKDFWYLFVNSNVDLDALQIDTTNLEEVVFNHKSIPKSLEFPRFKVVENRHMVNVSLIRQHVLLPDYGIEEPLIYADKLEENGFEAQATRIRKAWYNADVIDLCRVLRKDVFYDYAAFGIGGIADWNKILVAYLWNDYQQVPAHVKKVRREPR